MATMCTMQVDRGNHQCLQPIVPSSELSLCARHLLAAHMVAEELGLEFLKSIVATELQGAVTRKDAN